MSGVSNMARMLLVVLEPHMVEGQGYGDLVDQMGCYRASWSFSGDSVWLVVTDGPDEDESHLLEALSAQVKSDDKILVIDVTGGGQSWRGLDRTTVGWLERCTPGAGSVPRNDDEPQGLHQTRRRPEFITTPNWREVPMGECSCRYVSDGDHQVVVCPGHAALAALAEVYDLDTVRLAPRIVSRLADDLDVLRTVRRHEIQDHDDR